ncbi:zinc finger BED domain-containing protein RICESLEEPER 2-like protein, partial [Tanacetum coccineum]
MYQEEPKEHVSVENVVDLDSSKEEVYCSDTKIHETITLRSHLKLCDKFPDNQLDGQTQLSIQRGDGDDRKMIAWKFDQSSVRRALAYMLIVDELPFKFVEGKGKEKGWFSTKGNVGQICLTTDTWTSLQRINYMYLTTHYVDNEWVLRKKVLNFFPMSSHRGVDIGKAMEMCLLKWGIESNVFTITVDNATTNNVAVAYLKNKFANWEKSVLEEIEKCQSTKGLILDVPTRWNTTYLMLETDQNYERAFSRYDSEDCHYRDDLKKTGVPVSNDWANVRRLAKFLEHFYELTLK